jgi:hypothetical protein
MCKIEKMCLVGQAPGWHETSGDDDGIGVVQPNGAKSNVVGNARVLCR